MDKETLSNYGWIVICILVLSVMIALATPFGTYVSNAVKSTARGLNDTSDKAMSVIGLNGKSEWNDSSNASNIKRNDIIPENATYYKGGKLCEYCYADYGVKGVAHGTLNDGMFEFENEPTATYTSGQAFPSVEIGDIYLEGDYKYSYFDDGWHLTIFDNGKTSYGQIISEIAKQPVTQMTDTFYGCTSLVTAPTIPNTITDMTRTFEDCTSLTTAPIIPDGVINMSNTFYNCVSLSTIPEIPNTVTNIQSMFYGCTSLTVAPVIPNNITSISNTFSGCSSLRVAPTIPEKVTNMNSAFSNCSSLITAPAIPNNVTNMYGTFSNCTSLATAPVIPDSVTNLGNTFSGCTSLVGISSAIPEKVTNISNMFKGCKLLSGTIVVNADDMVSYSSCFMGTVKPIIITGESSLLDIIASDYSNVTSTSSPAIERNGIIPDGATYTFKSGKVLVGNGTNAFPDKPKASDKYEEEDYIYTYGNGSVDINTDGTAEIVEAGWNVSIKDKAKTSYGKMISSIAGKPVVGLSYTFQNCTKLKTAPVVSENALYMFATFSGCTSLTRAPTIPQKVIKMGQLFFDCKALRGTVVINANPTQYSFCFTNIKNNIKLAGSSTMLSKLASGNSYVTVK